MHESTSGQLAGRRRPLSRRRKLLFFSIFMVYLVLLTELATRCYWTFARKLSFVDTTQIWHTFYPEWVNTGVDHVALDKNDGVYDVLLLGGSVVNEGFGDIGVRLEKGLQEQLRRPVRVCNLSFAARTSRDSLIKYRELNRQHFDLVVVYHGINDTRMNNCPASLYRDDYLHCAWYHKIAMFQQHVEKKWLVCPFTLRYMAVSIVDQLPLGWYTPRMNPRDEWLEYGATVKTANAFHNNLSEIASLARQRGARVLLMTFAYHLPQAAAGAPENQNDHAVGRSLVEIWGRPRDVAAAIDAHNLQVNQIVREQPDILLVDQQARITKDKSQFYDCCHFTREGCASFVGNILATLATNDLVAGSLQ